MEETLPRQYIRGIRNKNYICDGYLTLEVFNFSSSDHNNGYQESSINWCDDEKTQAFSLEQKNENGDILFGYGLAILNTDTLQKCIKQFNKMIGCERYMVEGNPYHGNILLQEGIKKQIKNMILNQLLLECEIVERDQIKND